MKDTTPFNLTRAFGTGHSGPYNTAAGTTVQELVERELGKDMSDVSVMVNKTPSTPGNTVITPGIRLIISPSKIEGA